MTTERAEVSASVTPDWTAEGVLAHLTILMGATELRWSQTVEQIRILIDERDRQYTERHDSDKEALATALKAADKALDILSESLKEYKAFSNEWRSTLDIFINKTPSREEIGQQFKALDEKVNDLRLTRSAMGGKDLAASTASANQKWIIGLIVTILIAIAGYIFTRP